MERSLKKVPGVDRAEVNLATQSCWCVMMKIRLPEQWKKL
ncbi:MAG: hypothetical protein ACLRXQ_09370 [Phascolarctobacterium faecium]